MKSNLRHETCAMNNEQCVFVYNMVLLQHKFQTFFFFRSFFSFISILFFFLFHICICRRHNTNLFYNEPKLCFRFDYYYVNVEQSPQKLNENEKKPYILLKIVFVAVVHCPLSMFYVDLNYCTFFI